MIAPISLEPSAIAPAPLDASELEQAMTERSLRGLADKVFHHGYVVSASQDEARELLAAAQHLERTNPESGLRWREALTDLLQKNRMVVVAPERSDLSEVSDETKLREGWRGVVAMAVLSTQHAADLGIHDCNSEASPELSPAVLARDSQTFSNLTSLAQSRVWSQGESRERFWEEVLQPLATRSRAVDICDRYMLRGLVHVDGGTRTDASPDSLVWLLRKLDQSKGPKTQVNLYVGLKERVRFRGKEIPGPETVEEASDLVGRHWKPGAGRIESLLVWGVIWRKMAFADAPHDRHIGFSCGADIGLERGLDSFDLENVKQAAGVAWSYEVIGDAPTKNRDERNAIARAGQVAAVI